MTMRPHLLLAIAGLASILCSCSRLGPARRVAAPQQPVARSETADDVEKDIPPTMNRPVSFTKPAAVDSADPPLPLPDGVPFARNTEAPSNSHPGPPPNDGSQGTAVLPIDLSEALAIAAGQNPRLAIAAARYREAYARWQVAHTMWLPSLRAAMSYNHHDGTLQASDGQILEVSRSALQGGLGAHAVGAGSPMDPGILAEFHAADALFQPKIASHATDARQAAARATTNDTLLATSLAYLDLLRAQQLRSIALETRDHAQHLADLTATFARTGQGSQADADRVQTELASRRIDVSRTEEEARVASARLAQLLSLDASTQFEPRESTIVPLNLVPQNVPVNGLIATGLSQRPELSEAQHLVCEAVYRYRREKYAPFVPSVLLGVSQSGFGGGLGSRVEDTGGRFDMDAAVYWELRNLGLGEQARRCETRAQYDQARAVQVSVMDQVAREVVESHAQVTARQNQMAIAEAGIASATDSYQRNLSRIREGQGLPIEVLQSLQALDASRREFLRTLVDYNEAQFRLQRALGWPIHAVPSDAPLDG